MAKNIFGVVMAVALFMAAVFDPQITNAIGLTNTYILDALLSVIGLAYSGGRIAAVLYSHLKPEKEPSLLVQFLGFISF